MPVERLFDASRSGLVEQRRWTMTVDVVLVSAATGEVLHRTTLREHRDYGELDKSGGVRLFRSLRPHPRAPLPGPARHADDRTTGPPAPLTARYL
ncbi:MAG: hypothetical protein MZU79_05070 [Anaerotruncus sp.]|nr:hypothetical protein [Anaerotruncus sp.]